MKKFEYIKVNASNWINEVSTEEQFDGKSVFNQNYKQILRQLKD